MSKPKRHKPLKDYLYKVRTKPYPDMHKTIKEIKGMSLEQVESYIGKIKLELQGLENERIKHLSELPKETLIDMIIIMQNEWIETAQEVYKLRNRGKEKQMENRSPNEQIVENIFKDLHAKDKKITLNTLTYELMDRYPNIKWQNNSDPELSEKKLKDVVKLKTIYSKLRKKYIR